ncbi:DUF2971 domain-containing protein [Rhodanobacter sp. A1T4]|uniref:DUF2971 domain-containing protein n=1 Tax=Rhodanobacter sp. A1T4 TaxID=2723087 RepID=UPI00160A88A9|nr:DUF2971 domain-containing protein [Rhodanobacter sp. A1T4]MBB6249159.1 hypothetical protein [Rhodanobacter sp. A1T4]
MIKLNEAEKLALHKKSLDEKLDIISGLPVLQRRIKLRTGAQPLPLHLYKYRSVPPFIEASAISCKAEEDQSRVRGLFEKLMLGNELWFANSKSFNDPFDCRMRFDTSSYSSDLADKYIQFLVKKTNITKIEATILVSNAQKKGSFTAQHLADLLNEHNLNLRDKFGIFSASLDPRNPLMWAHYAQEHHGVCLQFEAAMDKLFWRGMQVSYEDKFPIQSDPLGHDDELDKEFALRMISQKSTDWRYEKERRLLHFGSSNLLLPYTPKALTGVILGYRCEDTVRSDVLNLIEKREEKFGYKVRIYRATMSDSRYHFSISRER